MEFLIYRVSFRASLKSNEEVFIIAITRKVFFNLFLFKQAPLLDKKKIRGIPGYNLQGKRCDFKNLVAP